MNNARAFTIALALTFSMKGSVAYAGICDVNPCVDDPTMIKKAEVDVPVETLSRKQTDAMLLSNKWFEVENSDWKVSESIRGYIKTNLVAFVENQAQLKRAKLSAWASYTFQLQGQTRNGRKLVFINAFCSKPPNDVAVQFVFVKDGGACYFHTYFEPDTKDFEGLEFNGIP